MLLLLSRITLETFEILTNLSLDFAMDLDVIGRSSELNEFMNRMNEANEICYLRKDFMCTHLIA